MEEKLKCGGSDKFESIKIGTNSHAQAVVTIRTNFQELSYGNAETEQYGYMLGKWLKKRCNIFFIVGLFKGLKE